LRFAIPLCIATAQETACRRKPEQQAVAGGLDDMSLVRGNEWIDQLFAMAFKRQVSALFIYAHETRVARHVGGDDRGKATI
jgi:hypothetical protein